jgi:protein-tyrosine kinase
MSMVERAIEKLRRNAEQQQQRAKPASPAVGSLVVEPQAPGEPGAPPARPARSIAVDRDALRNAGYLPETTVDRAFANHYRQIKRPLISGALASQSLQAGSPRLIMMASALPGDGKTFTSINLALSMARERDISVVLVDADIPKPHVSRIFGVEREKGLLEALVDPTVDVETLVLPTDVGGLSILPAGTPHEGATELLSSARMVAVVARLLAQNPRRIVLFDSPPLLASSESRAIAAVVGQVILVVKSGVTPRRAVEEALDQVGEGKSVGLILNQGRIATGGGYYGYGNYGDYGATSDDSAAQ